MGLPARLVLRLQSEALLLNAASLRQRFCEMKEMKKGTHWLFLAAVVMVPVTLFAVMKWYNQNHTPLLVLGPAGHKVAAFSFTNQNGQAVSDKNWEEKIVVAHCFFTHCPVVCPKMVHNLQKVQEAFAGDKQILFASFTVDPQRDSAAQLLRYANRMKISGNWHLLTGEKKLLYNLARHSLLLTATTGDGGAQDFIHSETLVLIDGQKRIRGFYRGTDATASQQLIRDVARLKKEN